jgi:hypothetical protein
MFDCAVRVAFIPLNKANRVLADTTVYVTQFRGSQQLCGELPTLTIPSDSFKKCNSLNVNC